MSRKFPITAVPRLLHTCRPDERMQDEIAGGTGTGQAGGSGWSSDALRTACGQPLVGPSCSTKVSYEPDWASAAGADSETMVVARRRRLWTARAAVHWVGMGDDAGPPSGEGQLHPLSPWMSCRVVMVVMNRYSVTSGFLGRLMAAVVCLHREGRMGAG